MKKHISLFLLTFIALSLCIPTAQAACNFIIKIGDKKTKIVKKFAEPMPMYAGQFMLPVQSEEVCPNDNLSIDIAIEYIFLGDPENSRLAAIRMVVLNDGQNTESNKLTLMNYAKKVYGDFDTGENPKIYNNFDNITQVKENYMNKFFQMPSQEKINRTNSFDLGGRSNTQSPLGRLKYILRSLQYEIFS